MPDQNKNLETMRPILSLLILLLLAIQPLYPATISGTVLDATDGKPLESASVFIAGTTFGTNTKPDGSFQLSFTPSDASQLIIAHLGYQTYTVQVAQIQSDQALNISLSVKPMQLSAVNVIGHDSNRKMNMADFLFGFFGDSEFGKKCTILNPNVLHLVRKPIPGKIGQNELHVSADSDLYIENKLLGYTVRYTLEKFVLSKFACSFKGYPLFFDNLARCKNQEKVLENRERAYLGSQMHFFRSLFTKTLQDEGFRVSQVAIEKKNDFLNYNNAYGLMADTVFVPEHNRYMVQTEKYLDLYELMIVTERAGFLSYKRPFEVRYTLNGEDRAYRKHEFYFDGMSRTLGQQTSIALLEDGNVTFYPNGALKNAGSLTTIGYWSFKKVGEILPWDYQPSKNDKHVVTLQKKK